MRKTSVTSTKPKLFRCNIPECPARHKSFTKSDLERHSGTHLLPRMKRFHCTLCDKHYVQKCGFQRHILEIHRHLQYSCQFCSQRFQKYDMRRAHLRKVHAIVGRGKNLGNGENVGSVAPLSASLRSAISPVLETFSPAPSLSWESDSESSSSSTSLPWDVSVSGAITNPPFMGGSLPIRSSNSNLQKMPNPDGDHVNYLLPSFFSSQTIPVFPEIRSLTFDSAPPQTVVAPPSLTTPESYFFGSYPAPPTRTSPLQPFPWHSSVSMNGASISAAGLTSGNPWLPYQRFIMSNVPL